MCICTDAFWRLSSVQTHSDFTAALHIKCLGNEDSLLFTGLDTGIQ